MQVGRGQEGLPWAEGFCRRANGARRPAATPRDQERNRNIPTDWEELAGSWLLVY